MITEDLSEYIAIALLVVAEKAKGDKSFWKSYIEVLPTVEEVSWEVGQRANKHDMGVGWVGGGGG